MAIVYQKDTRSGITYAYESKSYWDKKKKQSRSKRTLIGRVDTESGIIVPTDGRIRKKREKALASEGVPLPDRYFFGATYLLDQISKEVGLIDDLKTCFPQHYTQILSIAYFMILEGHSPLSRFGKWAQLHHHPYGDDIPSQRSSELFALITEAQKQQFFQLQGERKVEKEYWAYDTSSISSYSGQLRQVQFGKNKEHDRLAQINLAMVFGQDSGLPFYYQKRAGNTPDSKTMGALIADLHEIGYKKVKLVMDRGFYSAANVHALYTHHIKFLLGVPMSLTYIRTELDGIYDGFRSFETYNRTYELYAQTVATTWKYEHKRPYKGDTITEDRRIYMHYYFNSDKAAEDEKAFDRRLQELRDELASGKTKPGHAKQYEKYFTVKKTPKRGIQITVNQEAVTDAKRYYGFFALISNQRMDAITALEVYRTKDVVEKAFGNVKDRMNMRRMLTSSERSLEGKLFVSFVGLILLSYLKKQMQDTRLFETYTMNQVFDTLDVIECYAYPEKRLQSRDLLDKQRDLYQSLGIKPPSSL
jgi:transposase